MAKVRTKRELAALFRHLGLHPRKHLGQNFLVDHNLLEFMVRAADVGPGDLVVDIGCGTGLLTAHLAEAAGKVIGLDFDRRLLAICSRYLEGRANVALVCGDALASKHTLSPTLLEPVERELASGRWGALKVVANLPYSVASLVVPNLLESALPVALMLVTVQKEVGDRMAATAGSGEFGALSLAVQAHAGVEIVRRVPPEVFWPQPKVTSSIVRLVPDAARKAAIRDYAFFTALVRAAFGHRRKTLVNALAASGLLAGGTPTPSVLLAAGGVAPTTRAQDVTLDQYVHMANALAAHKE